MSVEGGSTYQEAARSTVSTPGMAAAIEGQVDQPPVIEEAHGGDGFDPFALFAGEPGEVLSVGLDIPASEVQHTIPVLPILESPAATERLHVQLAQKHRWIGNRASWLSGLGALACLFHFHGATGLGVGVGDQRRHHQKPSEGSPASGTNLGSDGGDFLDFLFGLAA